MVNMNMNKYRMLSNEKLYKGCKLSRYAINRNCLCRSIALNTKILVNHKEYNAQNASYNIKRKKDGPAKRDGGYLYNRRIVLFSLTEAARICSKKESIKHKLETYYSKNYTSILKILEVGYGPDSNSV